MNWHEVNFDGLIGPTHNYAGLSFGNFASSSNRFVTSTPRAAALQGLAKVRAVAKLGVPQAVLPPQLRPNLNALRSLGFQGNAAEMIEQAYRENPSLLAACYSASNMWTANAATVSPSPDTADHRVHLTPANLNSTLHRAIESAETFQVLSFLFADENHFCVHRPLPGCLALADEGAANHTRLCDEFGSPGLELFVYGRNALQADQSEPQNFPARQALQASESISRLHGLSADSCSFVKQNPAAIDAGAFHNDVVAVGHQNILLFHESAYADKAVSLDKLRQQFHSLTGSELCLIEISESELSLGAAVRVYLFNSQLVTLPNNQVHLICPDDCQRDQDAKACLDRIIAGDNYITAYTCLDLRQSMMNGGGPACLRLRVVLNDQQLAGVHQGVMFTPQLDKQLTRWIENHYREEIAPEDLRDPNLALEATEAINELETILDFPQGLLTEN